MSGGQVVAESIRAANREGRPALTAFLSAGYPARESFADTLSAVSDEVDVVEVGVPFSDPMADGVTIQRASRSALEAGVTLPWILDEIARASVATPVMLMSYLNPLLAYGPRKLADAAAASGVSGLIIPDLPYEESDEFLFELGPGELGVVQFVTPVTPRERIAMLCARSSGFVYAVTRTGTTGGSFEPGASTEFLSTVRELSPLPVQAGFGVRHPDHVRAMAPFVDGLIVGSALVERLEAGDDPAPFLRSLRDAAWIAESGTPGHRDPPFGNGVQLQKPANGEFQ